MLGFLTLSCGNNKIHPQREAIDEKIHETNKAIRFSLPLLA